MKNNLIEELFDKNKAYRMGILCTYSLNIEFLENYLLNLDGLASCNNLNVFTDRNIYNKQFENNSLLRSKWINKRYLLTPIDTNGVFHPKLYILASDKSVKIGIGSANLTREGLATNLEIASVFEITKKDKTYLGLLLECLEFLKSLADDSNSISAISSVNDFVGYIGDFLEGQQEENVHLLYNLNKSISSQVLRFLKDYKVKEIDIISPFYDKNLKVLNWLKNSFPDASVNIFVQQGKSNFPVTEYGEYTKDTKIYVYKNQERYIHGKAIMFTTNAGNYVLTGSANFTKSAMLSVKYNANVETSLWGLIDKEFTDTLKRPNGYKAVLLKHIKDLNTTPIHTEEAVSSGNLILDWLVEVLLVEDQVQLVLRNKEGYIPKTIFFNGDRNKTYEYAEKIDITGINKSDIMYAQVAGIDVAGTTVESGKMWIVNLDRDKVSYSRKRYSVSEPSQLTEILKNLVQNGTEEELIDYLLKFDIPLDLVGLNFRNSGLRALESQGNIFGELKIQRGSILNHPGMYDAINHFLFTNYNKLCQHCDNVQLLKLNNFILIFSAMFNMMNTINDHIVMVHRKNPIEASEWSKMREYYDLFLKYSIDCLELLYLTDENYYSFEELVNVEIKNDSQKMLGNIKTFKEFVVKMGYNYYLFDCYKTTKNICKWVNAYIKNGRVLTIKGTIVSMPVSYNGMRDTYIIKRKKIYKYATKLENELKS